jgi:hypothetical protein
MSDGERRANFHSALCSVGYLGRFGLFRKMNRSLVAIVRYEIRSFFETGPAQSATGIHIPLYGQVLGLFAQFVRHN